MLAFLKRYKQDDTQAVQADFIANVQAFAASFVETWTASEPGLDYSAVSLGSVDALLARVRQGALTLTPVQKIEAAAYVYEVARRAHGGLYEVCDDDDPVVLVTGEPDAEVCLCAISKVEALTREAPGEGLPAFFNRYVRGVQARSAQVVR